MGRLGSVLRSPDLRILTIMLAGISVFGILDGSLWRYLLAPSVAYRPAILFGLTLVFGWRGFAWSQLLFLTSFTTTPVPGRQGGSTNPRSIRWRANASP